MSHAVRIEAPIQSVTLAVNQEDSKHPARLKKSQLERGRTHPQNEFMSVKYRHLKMKETEWSGSCGLGLQPWNLFELEGVFIQSSV